MNKKLPLDALVILADNGDNKNRSALAAEQYHIIKEQTGIAIPIYAAGTWSGANPEELGTQRARAFVIQDHLLAAGVPKKNIHLVLDYGKRGGDTSSDLITSAAAIDRMYTKEQSPLIGIVTDKWHARIAKSLIPYTWTPRLRPIFITTQTDLTMLQRTMRAIVAYAARRMFKQAGVPRNTLETTHAAFKALETHHPMFAVKPPKTLYNYLVNKSLHSKHTFEKGYSTKQK